MSNVIAHNIVLSGKLYQLPRFLDYSGTTINGRYLGRLKSIRKNKIPCLSLLNSYMTDDASVRMSCDKRYTASSVYWN